MKSFFRNNGFQNNFIEFKINKFLSQILTSNIAKPQPSNANKTFYISFPYFGAQSENLKLELLTLLRRYFTDINFHIILVNKFTIQSIFPFKDRLPIHMRSSLVYKYSCSRCESQYVGSTTRTLGARVAEHVGRSYRTERFLAAPLNSSIRDHSYECDSKVSIEDFKILTSNSNSNDLRILESLYIFKLKPKLNDHKSAVPLNILSN